ncbi:hypothetical protein F5144DRAFT_557283 [Chaetomium tenue]|uniref:Uncharacterized protein n=1 Tax=Chaetomium tenue TaxID=1854479 RepID=A0ACB7PR35_9PEZI|nr:hypothetical protein F5144DRAFT_557283 [Chaetomium globosum]
MARPAFPLLAALFFLSSFTTANTCNGDNCLNALRQHSASALDFCHSYTTALYGTAAPTPTFVPTTCSPQRLSSACYCADQVSNPTYTPPACPAGQVIQNPSFYGQPATDTSNVNIKPWVIAVPTGAPGCVPAGSYSTADMSGAWGDPRSIQCSFDPVIGGLSTITQDIKLCPAATYTLRLASACNFWTGSGDFGVEFKVSLSGVTILPWAPVCPFCADPNNSESGCRSGAYFEKHNATMTGPASGSGSLVISVRQPAGLNAAQVPALFDQIFVNPLGDTSSNNPAQIGF